MGHDESFLLVRDVIVSLVMETSVARTGTRRNTLDNSGLIPILARKVREVEAKAQTGKKVGPTNRTKFQVIAFLVREERARVKGDASLTDASRAEQLKRLDGVATILAKTAARDTSLIQLLEVDPLQFVLTIHLLLIKFHLLHRRTVLSLQISF